MNKLAWIFAGFKGKQVEPEVLMTEAFLPEKRYLVAFAGIIVLENKTLEEVEAGYFELLKRDSDAAEGYGLVYRNEDGEYLFMPTDPLKT